MLLESAVGVGLSHTEFWALSLREFGQVAKAYHKRKEAEQRERWQHTAVISSYIANMVGGAVAGSKWQAINPQDLVKKWLDGVQDTESRLDRLKRVDGLHKERLMREKSRRAA